MGRETYKRKGSILEEHVNLPFVHLPGATESEKVIMIRVEEQQIVLDVEAVSAQSTANQSQTAQVEICLFELDIPVTGGIPLDTATGLVSANLDREAGRDLIGLEVLQDVTYDLTGATRLMLEGVEASNRVRNRNIISGVNYSLKRNTDYLIRSTIVNGDTGNTTSYFIADFTLISEKRD